MSDVTYADLYAAMDSMYEGILTDLKSVDIDFDDLMPDTVTEIFNLNADSVFDTHVTVTFEFSGDERSKRPAYLDVSVPVDDDTVMLYREAPDIEPYATRANENARRLKQQSLRRLNEGKLAIESVSGWDIKAFREDGTPHNYSIYYIKCADGQYYRFTDDGDDGQLAAMADRCGFGYKGGTAPCRLYLPGSSGEMRALLSQLCSDSPGKFSWHDLKLEERFGKYVCNVDDSAEFRVDHLYAPYECDDIADFCEKHKDALPAIKKAGLSFTDYCDFADCVMGYVTVGILPRPFVMPEKFDFYQPYEPVVLPVIGRKSKPVAEEPVDEPDGEVEVTESETGIEDTEPEPDDETEVTEPEPVVESESESESEPVPEPEPVIDSESGIEIIDVE